MEKPFFLGGVVKYAEIEMTGIEFGENLRQSWIEEFSLKCQAFQR